MVSPSHIIPFFKVYFNSLFIGNSSWLNCFYFSTHDLLVERLTTNVPVGMGLLVERSTTRITLSSCRVIVVLVLKILNFCADI